MEDIDINVTNHAREKYLERIQGVRGKKEIARLISTDKDRIDSEIEKLFRYSDYIYTGQLGGNNTNADYYLNTDTALVVKNKNKIITIFQIKFGFPGDMDSQVIKSLKNKIVNLSDEIIKEEDIINEKNLELTKSEDELKEIIKQKEMEIENLKQSISMIQHEKTIISNEYRLLKQEQKVYSYKLFGNTDLKEIE